MKTLQNDLTTIEQSKRLLELGVPKNSANHYYGKDGKLHYIDGTIPYSLLWETECIPCWSVGRLIEIAHICSDSTLSYKEEANEIQKFKEEHKCETLIEAIILCITDAFSIGSINFSKLEE